MEGAAGGGGSTLPLFPEKDFFNIGEACRILQVPAHTLRYWESRFRALRPTRLPGGHRRFTRSDIETAHRIKHLLQDKKMTVEGARRVLAERSRNRLPQGPGALTALPPAARRLLVQAREDLASVLKELSED